MSDDTRGVSESKRPSPNKAGFEAHLRAGQELIPLHRWDAIDGRGRQRGKSPRDRNWPTMPYDPYEVIDSAIRHSTNVGVRLRDRDLVVDVDPRNFPKGDDPFRRLCDDLGLD